MAIMPSEYFRSALRSRRDYAKQGKTVKEIGKELNRGKSAIYIVLQRFGIKRPSIRESEKTKELRERFGVKYPLSSISKELENDSRQQEWLALAIDTEGSIGVIHFATCLRPQISFSNKTIELAERVAYLLKTKAYLRDENRTYSVSVNSSKAIAGILWMLSKLTRLRKKAELIIEAFKDHPTIPIEHYQAVEHLLNDKQLTTFKKLLH